MFKGRSLKGKVIVLTGASSGIGRSTALALAREGAILHLVARREQRLEEVCRTVRQLGGTAAPHVFDVRDPDAFASMAHDVHAKHGHIDVLINNAGVGATKTFLETSNDDWKWTFDTNFYSAVFAVRAFLPNMVEHGGGTIVNIASIAGITGSLLAAYSASKFAIIGLSESLMYEYGERGIEVVVVCPGIVNTEIAVAAIDAGRSNASLGSSMREFMQKHGASPDVVARDIVRAIRKPEFMVLTPMHANLMRAVHRMFPGLSRKLSRRMSMGASQG